MTEYFYKWDGNSWYLSDGSGDFVVGSIGSQGPIGAPGISGSIGADSISKAISYNYNLFQSNQKAFNQFVTTSNNTIKVDIDHEILSVNIPSGFTLQYLIEAYLLNATLIVTDDNMVPTTFATLTTASASYEYNFATFVFPPNYNQGIIIDISSGGGESNAIGINLIAQWV